VGGASGIAPGWNHNGFRDYIGTLGSYLESDPIWCGRRVQWRSRVVRQMRQIREAEVRRGAVAATLVSRQVLGVEEARDVHTGFE